MKNNFKIDYIIISDKLGDVCLSCILRIKNSKNSFTDSEKRIAEYIMEHRDDIYNLTVEELSAAIGTSSASIVRFAQKIGYSGYQELKLSLAVDTRHKDFDEEKIYEAISINDSTDEIMEKVALENIKAIKDTLKLLDKEVIDEAVETISSANKINLCGVGSSTLVAADFHYKLTRINMPASLYTDYHLQMVSAANMHEKDVAIGISHSGKTFETYKALETAKKAGAKTISITKFGGNPISKISDIKIYTTEVEKHLRMGAIASRIAQLTVIDILFINIVKKNYDVVSDYILNTGNIIAQLKMNE